jgi:ribosomal-protein-alanine N-acetyltransferase
MPKEGMIRVMRFEDLDAVCNIEHGVFPNPWPRVFFEKDLESSNTVAFVFEENGQIIGYAVGACIDVELHITNIAVAAGYQRRGTGLSLLQKMEDIAIERACNFAYLEVRTNNVAAINMYKKYGYDILYTRKRYYIDGDDAYVMHKELK